MSWSLVIGFALTLFISGTNGSCFTSDILNCERSSGLSTYLLSIGIDIDDEAQQEDSWIFTLDRTQMGQYCSKFEAYRLCVSRDVTGCNEATELTMESVNNAFRYICGDRFEEYITQFQPCLEGQQVRDSLKACARRYVAIIERQTTLQGICNALVGAVQCDVAEVSAVCSQGSTDWYEGLANEIYKPVRRFASCASPDDSPASTTTLRSIFTTTTSPLSRYTPPRSTPARQESNSGISNNAQLHTLLFTIFLVKIVRCVTGN